ncbi:MAG TPA: lipoprotein [Steroidobacteraceae bacterium]|jgi:predicted small lipoprotein YifL
MTRFAALTAAPVARLCVLALIAMSVAGCGQKGALYLPDKNGSVITRPAAPGTQQSPPAQAPKKKDDDSSAPK